MPRLPKFSKDDIVSAGLSLVRASGTEAVSARALGKELGTSSSPVFTMFKDMSEVMDAIHAAAEKVFIARMEGVTDYFPAFKEFGLRLVAFAKEDPNVFQMLFLENGSSSSIAEGIARQCLDPVEQGYGLGKEQAEMIFRQMWPVACGLAVLCIKHPGDFPEETLSKTLSYHFAGLMSVIKSGTEVEDVKPQINSIYANRR